MKGVSQILGAVILLGVAIAVTGVYSGWATGFAESITSSTVDQVETDMKCDNANIRAENVQYSYPGTRVLLDVVNTGTISFHEGLTVYAINQSQNIGETDLTRLEVEERREVEFFVSEEPEAILVSSTDCPEIRKEITQIETLT